MAALRKFRYAHRGLYDKEAGIPENSLPAFSRAIARGFGAELDVHLLRDGTLAVFHDSDVKRMTGREGYLEDLSADELKDYALDGTKETIPQFKDVLALFAGNGPAAHCGGQELSRQLCRADRAHDGGTRQV